MKRVIQYVEEFCQVCHYRCLMPVEYEEEDAGGEIYRKLSCVCTKAKSGECQEKERCAHYLAAPDELNITETVIP